MKKIFLSSILLFFIVFSIKAQDIIRLKTGEELKVSIIKVSDKEIEYKKLDNLDGPVYAVSKNQVASLDFAKTEENSNNQFGNVNNSANPNNTQQQAIDFSPLLNALKQQQEQLNKQSLQIMNNISTLTENWIAHDTAYQNSLKRQSDLIQLQQQQIQQQINQISKNVSELSNSLLTQNKSKEKWLPKPVGLGVDLAGVLGKTDASGSYQTYSQAVILLSLTPDPNFRFETEFAAFLFSNDEDFYYFSVGLLGMWQKGNANFYTGVKILRIMNYQITTLNPTIGGEYVFGNHFSIGSEIGFPFAMDKNDEIGIVFGFNRLIFRFYL